ncbi:MAG TPA: hypothetical protein VJ508_00310, partial [Saprospiraceae bacterium]|nr:hypothetical protein [Saprospiraceae bacterium]
CKPQPAETTTTPAEPAAPPAMTKQDSVKRGEYLVAIMGCNDCHSPKIFTKEGQMLFDTSRLLSGHPAGSPMPTLAKKSSTMPQEGIVFGGDLTSYVGPWGTSYSANLTPDVTGIGDWTFEMFRKAFTEGKFNGVDGGRPIMPPMPWQGFAHINNDDIHMIWTYLRSLKPVSNKVPAYTPPAH